MFERKRRSGGKGGGRGRGNVLGSWVRQVALLYREID